MSEAGKTQRSAIEAVAAHFSAPWQSGENPPNAYVTVGGRPIALDVAVLAQRQPSRKHVATARLREDRVARRVLCDIESALRAHVPDGKALVLTLGAPIKVPAKLLAALTSALRIYLKDGTDEIEEKEMIFGNRVRFRVVTDTSEWNAKVIGFVFTGDPAPGVLAETMRSLHSEIVAKARIRLPARFAGERWLVLHDEHPSADLKTYRSAYTQLSPQHDFRRILMVMGVGRVETLAEV